MWIVASDVDGTLTGDRAALDRLAARLTELRASGRLRLIYSTGRRLEQVVSGIADEGLPEPDAVICQVGTEIYVSPLSQDLPTLEAWRELLLREYHREEAEAFLEAIPGLRMQPEMFNTELKTSCFLDECPNPEAAAQEIRRRVAPFANRYQVTWSSGRDLDILPASSGKGKAIRFLLEILDPGHENVVVAGDTGNDATMFQEFPRGIIVANAQPELVEVAEELNHHQIYRATHSFAGGVEEGLEHFGVLNTDSRLR